MKPTHGGKRTNAGRKPAETPRKAVTVRLSEPVRNRLADIKQETGKTLTAIIEGLVMQAGKGEGNNYPVDLHGN